MGLVEIDEEPDFDEEGDMIMEESVTPGETEPQLSQNKPPVLELEEEPEENFEDLSVLDVTTDIFSQWKEQYTETGGVEQFVEDMETEEPLVSVTPPKNEKYDDEFLRNQRSAFGFEVLETEENFLTKAHQFLDEHRQLSIIGKKELQFIMPVGDDIDSQKECDKMMGLLLTTRNARKTFLKELDQMLTKFRPTLAWVTQVAHLYQGRKNNKVIKLLSLYSGFDLASWLNP